MKRVTVLPGLLLVVAMLLEGCGGPTGIEGGDPALRAGDGGAVASGGTAGAGAPAVAGAGATAAVPAPPIQGFRVEFESSRAWTNVDSRVRARVAATVARFHLDPSRLDGFTFHVVDGPLNAQCEIDAASGLVLGCELGRGAAPAIWLSTLIAGCVEQLYVPHEVMHAFLGDPGHTNGLWPEIDALSTSQTCEPEAVSPGLAPPRPAGTAFRGGSPPPPRRAELVGSPPRLGVGGPAPAIASARFGLSARWPPAAPRTRGRATAPPGGG